MTNAITKKEYERIKNHTVHTIEFYPDKKEPSGFKRSMHVAGASMPRAIRTAGHATARGGFALIVSHELFEMAREIDENRNSRDKSKTFYGWDYGPIRDLLERAGKLPGPGPGAQMKLRDRVSRWS